ncbi:gamma carbonic anhydrase family protein [Denitromonas halophila]|uniref:Gamma carbonic anhydrase family protein n=1 Tax=Denitromonas halophila TaxID=1629404 RepID=A0A557R2W2_9RHOO|nr:gamma carbonic anhydrase family protein [Denitromonas halophila]TVO59466.1 gamma carbonic anhydrase family protein [Denitromonas halophila]
MLFTHLGHAPTIDPDAWVAPTATVCGNVHIGPGCRVMHGAQIIAEGSRIDLGECVIVLENAVLRSTADHALTIGKHCLVGPGAHVVGCTVADDVFIATGASVFHGARLGQGCEVRINAVVHLRTSLPPGETVPIGWVAVGDPLRILPPDQHDAIWAAQAPLDFPKFVYGFERAEVSMAKITRKLSASLGSHRDDAPVSPPE